MTTCTRRLSPSPKELMAWYGAHFALLLVAQNGVLLYLIQNHDKNNPRISNVIGYSLRFTGGLR